jgi:hypothetical protein
MRAKAPADGLPTLADKSRIGILIPVRRSKDKFEQALHVDARMPGTLPPAALEAVPELYDRRIRPQVHDRWQPP